MALDVMEKDFVERIHSYRQWGAKKATAVFPLTRPRIAVVHHMDTPNRPLILDPYESVQFAYKLVRQCQENHMQQPPYGNGWADTGQNFTITRDGVILEGRHGSVDAILQGRSVRAAHCADLEAGVDENDSPGVEHEGTYTRAEMPDAQWSSSVWLFSMICLFCRIGTSLIQGHRDTGCRTTCCGDALHAQLLKFRRQCHDKKLAMVRIYGMRR